MLNCIFWRNYGLIIHESTMELRVTLVASWNSFFLRGGLEGRRHWQSKHISEIASSLLHLFGLSSRSITWVPILATWCLDEALSCSLLWSLKFWSIKTRWLVGNYVSLLIDRMRWFKFLGLFWVWRHLYVPLSYLRFIYDFKHARGWLSRVQSLTFSICTSLSRLLI